MALLDINYLSTTLPAEVGDQCDDYDTNTDRDGPDATPTKQGVDNRAEMGYLTPLNGHNPLDVLGGWTVASSLSSPLSITARPTSNVSWALLSILTVTLTLTLTLPTQETSRVITSVCAYPC